MTTFQRITFISPDNPSFPGLLDIALGNYSAINNNRYKTFFENALQKNGFLDSHISTLKSSEAFNGSYAASTLYDNANKFEYLELWDNYLRKGATAAWAGITDAKKEIINRFYLSALDLIHEILPFENLQELEIIVSKNPNKSLDQLNIPFTPVNLFLFDVLTNTSLKQSLVTRFSSHYTFNGNLDNIISITPTFAAGRILIETILTQDNGAIIQSIRSN